MTNYDLCADITYEEKTIKICISISNIEDFSGICNAVGDIFGEIDWKTFELNIFYEDTWVRLFDLDTFYYFVSNNLTMDERTKLLIKQKPKFDVEI
jgi:hypothetical protein